MPVTRMALYIYKYTRARIRVCQKAGRGWQRDDTKGLIVLAGDSRGLHGRWPGNGYFYRWNTQPVRTWPPGNRKGWGGYVSLTIPLLLTYFKFRYLRALPLHTWSRRM